MNIYTIQEVAKLTKMPSSTLRFYESKGLLSDIKRSDSGYRIYNEEDVEILRLIDCLKKTNMSLKDISQFIELAKQGESSVEDRLELLRHQKTIVERQISELNDVLKTIESRITSLEQ